MKVVAPTEEHLRSIKVRPYEIEDFGENIDDATIQYFLTADRAYTLLDDEENVVAVMGGTVAEDKTCHAWMIASELIYKHPVATLKLILRIQKEGVELNGVKLFYTYNLPNFPREIEYLKATGYQFHSKSSDFDDNKERLLFIKRVK